MNQHIKSVAGYEVLDSRGFPTVCAKVILNDGTTGIASVPSGASKGMFEAAELRDSNRNRYFSLGVKSGKSNCTFVGQGLCPCPTMRQSALVFIQERHSRLVPYVCQLII